MEVINGTIISYRVSDSGCWYTIMSENGKNNFFSRKKIFSLFESCEVVLVNKNCSYFLSDYQHSFRDAPLKQFPVNLVAASWFSVLAESLHDISTPEINFVEKCAYVLSSGAINEKKLSDIENFYLSVSGFGENDKMSDIFMEYFPRKMRLRNSLLYQIKRGGYDRSPND